MLKIAICDDEKLILEHLIEKTRKITSELNKNVEIISYNDGQTLVDTITSKGNSFDILMLDIDMPTISGLEVAKIVRATDNNTIIIFISSHESYVFESFEYNPFRFIRKYRIEQEFAIALEDAIAVCEKNIQRYIVVKDEDRECRIAHSQICYFELIKRKLYIHLENEQILKTWKTVQEFLDDLDDRSFVKFNKGCVVNLKYVSECRNTSIILDNGTELMASRAGIKLIRQELLTYWGEHV